MVLQTEPRSTYVDLINRPIYGWEPNRPLMRVLSLVTGILDGDKLPPVHVVYDKRSDDPRLILPTKNKFTHLGNLGGHGRTLAYYVLRRPMPSLVLPIDEEKSGGRADMRTGKLNDDGWSCWGDYKEPKGWMVDGVRRLIGNSTGGSIPATVVSAYFRSTAVRRHIGGDV